ncbi:MAG: sugar kinase, partial [Acidobacteria bacterium]|nr:sugar kinase [Acidobacteriota bacterium]
SDAELPAEIRQQIRESLKSALHNAAGLIVSDYGYGAVFEQIVSEAKAICDDSGIVVVVDSRHRLVELAQGAHATPNQEELQAVLGDEPSGKNCSRLRSDLGLRSLLATNGNKGMMLFTAESDPVELPAVGSTQPVDVTGAGDTVIAAYSLGLAAGLPNADAARIANHAGGIVVMKHGTATVSPRELIDSIEHNEPSSTANSA